MSCPRNRKAFAVTTPQSPTHLTRPRTWDAAVRATVFGATVLMLTSCTSDQQPSEPATDGPLMTTLDAGGVSADRPGGAGTTWSATFGSLILCTKEPVTLLGAEAHMVEGDADVRFALRTVPVPQERSGPALDWAPVVSQLGTPEQLSRRNTLRWGTLTDVAGSKFDQQTCGTDRGDPFTEILTIIETGDSGALVDRVDVSYETADREYTLPVNWSFVACGDAITDPSMC